MPSFSSPTLPSRNTDYTPPDFDLFQVGTEVYHHEWGNGVVIERFGGDGVFDIQKIQVKLDSPHPHANTVVIDGTEWKRRIIRETTIGFQIGRRDHVCGNLCVGTIVNWPPLGLGRVVAFDNPVAARYVGQRSYSGVSIEFASRNFQIGDLGGITQQSHGYTINYDQVDELEVFGMPGEPGVPDFNIHTPNEPGRTRSIMSTYFRSGDEVIVLEGAEKNSAGQNPVGMKGRVIDVSHHNIGVYLITWNGNTLDGRLDGNTGWWIDIKHLKHVKPGVKKQFKYGVELECFALRENMDQFTGGIGTNLPHFRSGSDGSIRIPDSLHRSAEIRTAYGLTQVELEDGMKQLGKLSKACHIRVNKTCGYHLHISHPALLDKEFIKKLLYFWVSIEDVLFSTQPTSRLRNRYCKRKLMEYLDKDGESLPEAKELLSQELGGQNRYYTLNLSSLRKYETIECRMHSGTMDATKVLMWARLLTAVFNYCLHAYNHDQVIALFNTTISQEKIDTTFDLLQLDPVVRSHFVARVRKFGWKRLISDQTTAIEIIKLKQEEKKLVEEFNKLNERVAPLRALIARKIAAAQK